MKKIALVVSLLFIGCAVADSAPTSVGYVNSQISALQNKISAVDANTVLTHTTTAGEIGQKPIYDATGNYASQTNALVTAEVANAAVQNAIDTEFVCTEWLDGAPHTNENCLIYTVRNPAPNRIVPNGYTALEYIESTGGQYIDTGVIGQTNMVFELDLLYPNIETGAWDWNMNGWADDAQIGIQGSTKYWWNMRLGKTMAELNTKYKTKLTINETTSSLYVNNNLEVTSVLGDNHSRYPFYLCGAYRPTGIAFKAKERIYKFKVSLGNTTMHDMRPARRDSDGKLGMYDLVSNTFFTNAGTGEFIAGPELNVYLPIGS